MEISRNQRRQLEKDNLKQPEKLTEIPRNKWPSDKVKNKTKIFRSRKFLVQEFDEENSIRISVNRTSMNSNGKWEENITWEELQEIKREIGYGNMCALEIYPKDKDIVNIANMRHIWLQKEQWPIGWTDLNQ